MATAHGLTREQREHDLGWLPHVLWGCVLLTIIGLWWRTYGGFQVGTYMDDAKYVILARSLAAGAAYGLSIGPAPPILTGYPFVFPLLLVPFLLWWPDALERMTVLSLAATLVNVALLYWGWPLLARTRSRWWALAMSALYGMAPLTLGHVGMVMAEPVFTAFVWAGLLLVEYGARKRSSPLWSHVLLGSVCAGAVFTRTVGAILCLAVCLRTFHAVGPSARHAIALGTGALLLIAPVLWFSSVSVSDLVPMKYVRTARMPSAGLYDPVEDDLAIRIGRGLQAYGGGVLREAIVPLGGGDRERAAWARFGVGDLVPLIGVALVALMVVGATLTPRSDRLRPAVVWFELLYVGVLLLWPYRSARLLYPVFPFLAFQLLSGVRIVAQRGASLLAPRGAARIGDTAAAIVVLMLVTVSPYRFARAAAPSTLSTPDYRAATAWLRDHAAVDAVVIADEWPAVSIYVQRPVVPASGLGSLAEFVDVMMRNKISYVLIAPERVWRVDRQRQYSAYVEDTLLPLVAILQRDGVLRSVYESDPRDMVRVYRVDEDRLERRVGDTPRR